MTAELRIREAQTSILLDELDGGRLDAVVIATPQQRSDLVAEDLFEDRFLLAATAECLRIIGAAAEALRPVALDPEGLLLLYEGHCPADQALEVCALDRR